MRKNKLALGLLLISIIGFTIYFFKLFRDKNNIKITDIEEISYKEMQLDGKEYRYNSSLINLLVLGIDSRDSTNRGQSDVIILLTLDRKKKEYSYLLIPRDTMTDIKYYDGANQFIEWSTGHINIAFAFGANANNGSMNTMQAVSRLLNHIPISKYITIYLDDLPKIQSLVGDFEVIIPNDSLIDIDSSWKKGNSILINENNVEQFLRTRDITVDYSATDRLERQETYIQAYTNKFRDNLSDDPNFKIDEIINFLKQEITNLSLQDFKDYGDMLSKYQLAGYDIIPGNSQKGIVYEEYIVDESQLMRQIVDRYYIER